MGSLHATEYANRLGLDVGLALHLQSNHYPPVSLDFLWVAKGAIKLARKAEAAYEEGDFDRSREIYAKSFRMPNGIKKTIHGIISGLHLAPWVTIDEIETEEG